MRNFKAIFHFVSLISGFKLEEHKVANKFRFLFGFHY